MDQPALGHRPRLFDVDYLMSLLFLHREHRICILLDHPPVPNMTTPTCHYCCNVTVFKGWTSVQIIKGCLRAMWRWDAFIKWSNSPEKLLCSTEKNCDTRFTVWDNNIIIFLFSLRSLWNVPKIVDSREHMRQMIHL